MNSTLFWGRLRTRKRIFFAQIYIVLKQIRVCVEARARSLAIALYPVPATPPYVGIGKERLHDYELKEE